MSPAPEPRTTAPPSRQQMLWPWWLNVLLAGLSYVGLCVTSRSVGLLPALHGNSGPTAAQNVAQIGLIVLPLTFLLAALIAKRRDRLAPLTLPLTASPSIDLSRMDWNDMMGLVTRVFSEMNYRVVERGQPGDAASLRLQHGEHTFIVQCQHWATPMVDSDAVTHLTATIQREGVTGGFLVTAGTYTPGAQSRTYLKNVGLIDGRRLSAMVERMQPHRDSSGPACPLCNGPMRARPHSADPTHSVLSWTCANFPSCWGSCAKD